MISESRRRSRAASLGRSIALRNKLTFQVIRRTIATLAQKKGTPKDIQGVLRHSRLSTTTDVYMQEIPESVKATVDACIDGVLDAPESLLPEVHRLYFEPEYPEFSARTMWSLSNAFTSALNKLDPTAIQGNSQCSLCGNC